MLYTRVSYAKTDYNTGVIYSRLEVIQGGSIYLVFEPLTADEVDALAPILRSTGISEFRFGPILDDLDPTDGSWSSDDEGG